MAIKIARGTDPFKKYWWVILILFALAGAWVCLPLMGGNTGGGSVAAGEAGLRPADQSLDAVTNPNGAPGQAVDLSMDGTGPYKKLSGSYTDSLYQSPAEPAARASAAIASAKASGGTLADALKDIASARAGARAAGGYAGGSASVAAPFAAAHANFGSMSGLGGGTSGSSASSFGSSSGRGIASMKPFGTGSPNVGIAYTQGLGGGKSEPAAATAKSALQSASNAAISAVQSGNLDTAARKMAGVFDNGGGSGLIGGPGPGGGGQGVGINGETVADLKPSANDYSKLNQETLTPVPPAPPIPQQPSMMQQILQMVLTMVVGGLVGGVTKAI